MPYGCDPAGFNGYGGRLSLPTRRIKLARSLDVLRGVHGRAIEQHFKVHMRAG